MTKTIDASIDNDDDFFQIINETGEGVFPEDFIIESHKAIQLYKWMKLVRTFDQQTSLFQRQGKIGTYASLEGQEAAQVGSAFALQKNDMIFPTYRDHGACFVHGLPMVEKYLFLKGLSGLNAPRDTNIFPITVPIATHIPHSVGFAMAIKYKNELNKISLSYFGDGATSEGDFHAGLNFSGVFKAPVVFFCQNNQYAISMPLHKQTASKTISQKALAYGIEGVRLDGNDVFAVYYATIKAREKALKGLGPTLIEAVTYRYQAHTSSDNSLKYRSIDEVNYWKTKDPIARMKLFLERRKWWSDKKEEELNQQNFNTVNNAFLAANEEINDTNKFITP